jgi:class 3 adenylate cyclase
VKEEGFKRKLTAHCITITDVVQQNRASVVDLPGDYTLDRFVSVVDAANCAVEIRREPAERNVKLLGNRQMQFRIAINFGVVIKVKERFCGEGVNSESIIAGHA